MSQKLEVSVLLQLIQNGTLSNIQRKIKFTSIFSNENNKESVIIITSKTVLLFC